MSLEYGDDKHRSEYLKYKYEVENMRKSLSKQVAAYNLKSRAESTGTLKKQYKAFTITNYYRGSHFMQQFQLLENCQKFQFLR
jgi:hypothetical protein